MALFTTQVPSGVIGVPVWFSDAQRHALLDACRVANFGCLKLFNETSAVALTYGIYKQDLPAETETPRRVVFVDFGHSQIQMSACEFVKGKLTVLGTSCNPNLGGRSFDLLLVDHFAKVFKVRISPLLSVILMCQDKYKLDVKANKRACVRLEQECEKLRKQMSSYAQALPINIECFMEDKDVSGKMGRFVSTLKHVAYIFSEEFEQLAAPVFAAVEAVAQNLVAQLEALGVKTADLYAVEVVGGTSRTPAVKALIARVFGKEVSTTLNLDEVIPFPSMAYLELITARLSNAHPFRLSPAAVL
jgi:molecular chaperone DnaK (HSP70)